MKMECTNCHITLTKEDIEIKYNNKCPMCNRVNTYIEEYIMDIKRISSDESFIQAMIELHEKDPIEYQLKMSQFKVQTQQSKVEEKSIPKCPHCSSTNIKSLSGLDRGMSIAVLGIFSKKINKSFECCNCKYTW